MRTTRDSNSKKESHSGRCIKPKARNKSLFGFRVKLSKSKPAEEKETLKEGMPPPDKINKGPAREEKGEELSTPRDLGGINAASQQQGFQPVPRRFSSLVATRRRSTFVATDAGHSQFDHAALTLAYLKLSEQTRLSDVDAGASTTASSSLLPLHIQLAKTWNGSHQAFNEETYGRRDSEASYMSEMNREEVLKSIIQSRGTGNAPISSTEGYPNTILTKAEPKPLTSQESFNREKPKGNLAIGIPPLGKSRFHMSEVKFPGPPGKPPNEKSVPGPIPTTESSFDTSAYLSMLSAVPVSPEPSPPPKRVSSFAPPGSYRASILAMNRPSQVALPPPPPLPAFFPPLPEPSTYNLTQVQSGKPEYSSKYVQSVA